jgi:hypothetical protein
MEQKEDLRRPRPAQQERHGNPPGQPQDLVYAHHGHAALGPRQCTAGWGSAENVLQGERNGRGGHHQKVGNGQVPELDGEQAPYLNAERVPGVFYIPQHGCYGHDGKPNPEEVEEAPEIAVVAVRIKVRHAACELDGWEEAAALLCAGLLSGCREGLDRWWRIDGYWRGATTVSGRNGE